VTIQKSELRKYPYVNVPRIKDVETLLHTQKASDTYFVRGSGEATKALDDVEATHRQWVKDVIDLTEFPYCYFVNGATDAIHHWKLTDKRDWQRLCYGEYEYPDSISTPGQVTCDVPGQYMDEVTGRASVNGVIDPNKPLYISVPSAADGNYFDLMNTTAPVILDCTYVSSANIQRINVPINTEQVFFSFTKGFGLVGQRLGLVYTKEPHKTLHVLKEFENWNYGGVKTMQLMMDNFAVDTMWNRYRSQQLEICKEYNFTPSDCFYLATTRDKYYTRRRRMRWNDSARICITPLFEGILL
tara:strand:+ start:90 stop:989 length:900 start_codon:yes stop_codon:yes gene_type:complete